MPAEPEKGLVLDLPLEDLLRGTLGITPEFGASLAQAAAVCLDSQGHLSPADMVIKGDVKASAVLTWAEPTPQAHRCWNDDEEATEHGAYGLAALLVTRISNLEVVERSKKGTGFDYWLGQKEDAATLFQRKARLEVSGIRHGSEAAIQTRVRQKVGQTQISDGALEAIVIVVEFASPQSRVVRRWKT